MNGWWVNNESIYKEEDLQQVRYGIGIVQKQQFTQREWWSARIEKNGYLIQVHKDKMVIQEKLSNFF